MNVSADEEPSIATEDHNESVIRPSDCTIESRILSEYDSATIDNANKVSKPNEIDECQEAFECIEHAGFTECYENIKKLLEDYRSLESESRLKLLTKDAEIKSLRQHLTMKGDDNERLKALLAISQSISQDVQTLQKDNASLKSELAESRMEVLKAGVEKAEDVQELIRKFDESQQKIKQIESLHEAQLCDKDLKIAEQQDNIETLKKTIRDSEQALQSQESYFMNMIAELNERHAAAIKELTARNDEINAQQCQRITSLQRRVEELQCKSLIQKESLVDEGPGWRDQRDRHMNTYRPPVMNVHAWQVPQAPPAPRPRPKSMRITNVGIVEHTPIAPPAGPVDVSSRFVRNIDAEPMSNAAFQPASRVFFRMTNAAPNQNEQQNSAVPAPLTNANFTEHKAPIDAAPFHNSTSVPCAMNDSSNHDPVVPLSTSEYQHSTSIYPLMRKGAVSHAPTVPIVAPCDSALETPRNRTSDTSGHSPPQEPKYPPGCVMLAQVTHETSTHVELSQIVRKRPSNSATEYAAQGQKSGSADPVIATFMASHRTVQLQMARQDRPSNEFQPDMKRGARR